MKLSILTCLIIVFAVGSVFGGSSLQIKSDEFDFGWLPYNSTVVTHFWFKSVGSDTLRIQPINTGCACARMPLEQDYLAPGDSMKVPYYWDTGRRPGAIDRRTVVHTDSYVDEVPILTLKGINVFDSDSLRPVSVKPYKFELSRIGQTSVDSIAFTLTNHSSRDFELTSVTVSLDECEVFIPDSLIAHKVVTGYIKVLPEYLDEAFERSFTIELKNAENYIKRITIPIRRKIFME